MAGYELLRMIIIITLLPPFSVFDQEMELQGINGFLFISVDHSRKEVARRRFLKEIIQTSYLI